VKRYKDTRNRATRNESNHKRNKTKQTKWGKWAMDGAENPGGGASEMNRKYKNGQWKMLGQKLQRGTGP